MRLPGFWLSRTFETHKTLTISLLNTTTTMAPLNSPSARSFLVLPPELRNIIYSNLYSSAERPTDLFTAAPPTNALILVCRQTYLDARGLYRHAHRRYWTDTRFWVNGNSGKTIEDFQKLFEILGLRNVDQIHSLEIKAPFAWPGIRATWVQSQRYWHSEEKQIGEDSWCHIEYFVLGRSTESQHRPQKYSDFPPYNEWEQGCSVPLSEQMVWLLGCHL